MIALEVKNLGKVYRLYQSPAHRLKEIMLRRPFHTPFHALSDINLKVYQGETVGIIGENGAGKSTFLKILAKTLKPTSGELLINGRTAALLELGAGFNPELSGEENIYLNAYLMGLTKAEIDERKQKIIDFSELGEFIKRPVKTYSSGMHIRLAFSIATSVNPDILIIDEALSVGDQHFQKKCIDRMIHFKRSEKTIVFCSHSLYHIREVCSKAMWLKSGRIERIGEVTRVIDAYTNWIREKDADFKISNQDTATQSERGKEKVLWIDSVKITDREGRELQSMKTGQDVWLRGCIRFKEPNAGCAGHIAVGLHRNDGEQIFGITSKMDGVPPIHFYDGKEVCMKFPSLQLLAGQYYFVVILGDEHALHPYDIHHTPSLSVENINGELGIVRLDHQWIFDE